MDCNTPTLSNKVLLIKSRSSFVGTTSIHVNHRFRLADFNIGVYLSYSGNIFWTVNTGGFAAIDFARIFFSKFCCVDFANFFLLHSIISTDQLDSVTYWHDRQSDEDGDKRDLKFDQSKQTMNRNFRQHFRQFLRI